MLFTKAYQTLFDRRHLCHNTKRKLSANANWKQLWPLTWAEMTSYACQTRGQSLGFNQTTFVALTKFAAPQILLQYMTSDYLTSCERFFYLLYRFTLVNKHEGTAWHFPVTFDLSGMEGLVCCKHRKVCCSYCHEATVRPFMTSDHNSAPFILWNQLVNSYLDDLLCSG